MVRSILMSSSVAELSDPAGIETLAVLGISGAIAAKLLGGWDMALQTLIGFMVADYLTGIVVAGVFKNSTKT